MLYYVNKKEIVNNTNNNNNNNNNRCRIWQKILQLKVQIKRQTHQEAVFLFRGKMFLSFKSIYKWLLQ